MPRGYFTSLMRDNPKEVGAELEHRLGPLVGSDGPWTAAYALAHVRSEQLFTIAASIPPDYVPPFEPPGQNRHISFSFPEDQGIAGWMREHREDFASDDCERRNLLAPGSVGAKPATPWKAVAASRVLDEHSVMIGAVLICGSKLTIDQVREGYDLVKSAALRLGQIVRSLG